MRYESGWSIKIQGHSFGANQHWRYGKHRTIVCDLWVESCDGFLLSAVCFAGLYSRSHLEINFYSFYFFLFWIDTSRWFIRAFISFFLFYFWFCLFLRSCMYQIDWILFDFLHFIEYSYHTLHAVYYIILSTWALGWKVFVGRSQGAHMPWLIVWTMKWFVTN